MARKHRTAKKKKLDSQLVSSFELPHSNHYSSFEQVQDFCRERDLVGVVACCRIGIRSIQTERLVGKRYRVVSHNEELTERIDKRFSQCLCGENGHAGVCYADTLQVWFPAH